VAWVLLINGIPTIKLDCGNPLEMYLGNYVSQYTHAVKIADTIRETTIESHVIYDTTYSIVYLEQQEEAPQQFQSTLAYNGGFYPIYTMPMPIYLPAPMMCQSCCRENNVTINNVTYNNVTNTIVNEEGERVTPDPHTDGGRVTPAPNPFVGKRQTAPPHTDAPNPGGKRVSPKKQRSDNSCPEITWPGKQNVVAPAQRSKNVTPVAKYQRPSADKQIASRTAISQTNRVRLITKLVLTGTHNRPIARSRTIQHEMFSQPIAKL